MPNGGNPCTKMRLYFLLHFRGYTGFETSWDSGNFIYSVIELLSLHSKNQLLYRRKSHGGGVLLSFKDKMEKNSTTNCPGMQFTLHGGRWGSTFSGRHARLSVQISLGRRLSPLAAYQLRAHPRNVQGIRKS